MGFYGNITNTSKTQFQFDKIYSSRYDMESQARTDGIYTGRYVLVEYDTELSQDSFYRVFINDDDGQMYNAPGVTADTNKLTIRSDNDPRENTVPFGAILFTADVDPITKKYINIVYYKVTGTKGEYLKAGQYKQITADKTTSPDGIESTVSNYTKNYAIDNEQYGAGRGYDSTVWQKTYINNVEKYIMIAELNSVVPTFGVSADAPTAEPIAPHFDTQSTDLYYKLHWQPAWGMRIAEGKLPDAEKPGEITSSKDPNHGNYPSDEDVSYSKLKYNSATKEIEEDKWQPKVNYKGAIYYNKAGFEDYKHTYYNGSFKDKISVQPLGISGMKYNEHGNSIEVSAQPDIQEISIILPSLGNALCDIWDKVYGYDDKNENLRYRDLEWKDAIIENKENGELEKFKGLTSPDRETKWEKRELGGKSYDPGTIAGCINLVHDLLGMILTTKNSPATKETYDLNKIFLKPDKKYYRIHKFPIYDDIDTSNVTSLNPKDYASDQEYNKAFRDAVNEIIKDRENEDWYLIMDDSQSVNSNRTVKRFNKKALTAAALNGHKLAVQGKDANEELKYGYEFVELKGFANDLSTINGLILELRGLIESDDSETRDRNTIQGSINTLNDIINQFNALTPGEFLICDNQGKVSSANWTTEQSFGYENLGDSTKSKEAPVKSETNIDEDKKYIKENQWIELSVDESADDKQIKLIHKLVETNDHKQDDTVTESDKNNASFNTQQISSKTLEDGRKFSFNGVNNNNNINILKLYTPIVDNAGHVVGKNTETVTLPYGYKYLETNNGADDIAGKDLYTNLDKDKNILNTKNIPSTNTEAQAEGTQDRLTVNVANKWIQTKVTNGTNADILEIAHEVHYVDEVAVSGETNLNDLTPEEKKEYDPNKIKIQDMSFDAAGHITANKAHTYVLPYGFKKITSSSTPSDVTKDAISNTATISANNTQDTLIIAPSNKWIKTFVENKTLSLGHTVGNIETTKKIDTNLNDKTNDADGQATVIQNTFTVNDITNDEAGHIIANQPHTYKLPDGYKTIKTSNDTSSSTIQVPESLTAIDQVASNTQDTITIKGADSWIKVKGENKTINIYHNSPNPKNNTPTTSANTDTTKKSIEENGVTTIIEENTPNFGSTFDIPQISYDKAGHISSSTKYSIKLPQPSVTPNTTGNVMTGISVDKPTGVFTQAKVNVGTLGITEFEVDQDEVNAENAYTLKASDSINDAFKKLQNRIKTEETNRASVIDNLDVTKVDIGAAKTIASLAETDGKIVIGEVTPIQIEQSQVTGLNTALNKVAEDVESAIRGGADVDITIQTLLGKIAALEKRISDLEKANNPTV